AFFTRHFGFRELAMRGRGRLAVLEDEAAVIAAYDDVRAGSGAIVHPLNRNRRGLMFYCACPGGVMVEVSARPPRGQA
ncbi:hypothetical protein ABTK05_20705, partial [Acinetobacter baumannii]